MKTKKTIFLLTVVLLYLISSCKKDVINNPAKDITGHWKWIYSFLDNNLSDSNPKTPQNTGIEEMLVFNSNHAWYKTQNNIKMDSGTYLLGHGTYIPYVSSYAYIYDSIVYYRNGIFQKGSQDYYDIFNDTLEFCGCFAGISAKSDPTEGVSKFYIKQK